MLIQSYLTFCTYIQAYTFLKKNPTKDIRDRKYQGDFLQGDYTLKLIYKPHFQILN